MRGRATFTAQEQRGFARRTSTGCLAGGFEVCNYDAPKGSSAGVIRAQTAQFSASTGICRGKIGSETREP